MKRTLALASLCLLAVFAVPTAADAATDPTHGPSYGPMGCATITPVAVTQGESAVFSCNKTFDPGVPVTVTVVGPGCSIPVAEPTTDGATTQAGQQAAARTAATFSVDAARDFSVTIDTDKNQSGSCTVTAVQGEASESASFQVSEATFASTGFDGAALPWIGGGLLVVGAALFAGVGIRRRRNA